MKKINVSFLILVTMLASVLAGCGGGGSVHGGVPILSTVNGVASLSGVENGNVILYEPDDDGDVLTTIETLTMDQFGNFDTNLNLFEGPVVFHVTTGTYTDPNDGSNWSLETYVTEVDTDTNLIGYESLGAVLPFLTSPEDVSITTLTDLAENLTVVLRSENIDFRTAATLANLWVSDYIGFDIMTTKPTGIIGLDGSENLPFDDNARYALIEIAMMSVYADIAREIDVVLGNTVLTTNHTQVMNLMLADIRDGELNFFDPLLPLYINPDDSSPTDISTLTTPPLNFMSIELANRISAWLDSNQNQTQWTTLNPEVAAFLGELNAKDNQIRQDP